MLQSYPTPYYPKAGKGRAPYELESMLRVHCVQLFYSLSDPATEDMLYEIERVRRFTGISLKKVPDETTILNFRHLLERHGWGQVLFESIKDHLSEEGLMLKEGTIVDASIIEAPASTKNRKRERDPEMKQTRKGNQWPFGMELHVGVDDQNGLVHSQATTSANMHNLTASEQLLHGEEVRVWGDAGYRGMEKREAHKDRQVAWHIAMGPSQRRRLARDDLERLMEECEPSVRAKVEQVFFYVKQMFGYGKVRYHSAPLLTTFSHFKRYIPLIRTQHLVWSIFMGLFRDSLTSVPAEINLLTASVSLFAIAFWGKL